MRTLLIFSMTFTTLVCVPLPAQEPQNVQVTTVELSAIASSVLSEARQARAAAAANDKPGAMTHLNQALSLTSQIAQYPHVGARQLIPVSTEIDTTSTYRPVKKSKDGELTANRLKRDSNVRDSTAEITHSSLDVGMAQSSLESARTALEANDLSSAERALASVQSAVVRESANENVPLLRAQQNLELARSRVLEGKYKDAVLPLRSAAQALEEYRQMPQAPHSADAQYMIGRINAYSDQINKDRGDALTNIDMWLNPVRNWYQEMIR
jgi:hypothetical protein